MTPIDRDAFERAIAMARAKGPAQQRQIDEKLATDPWAKVGEFAAYGCQMDSLHLKLWQPPPCWINTPQAVLAVGDDGIMGNYAAARLLQKMLAADLSKYEPDPLNALFDAAAQRKRKDDHANPPH